MKKLIAILFLVVLFSCEKEKTYCWKCTLYSSYSGKIIHISDYCDKSEKDIIAMEQYWRNLGSNYECVKR